MNAPIQKASLPLRAVQDVRSLLINDQAKQQLAAVAAHHMRPERLMRVVANAIRTTPKLQEAEPLSFLGALMQCAALGLEPNSQMGHAYLVPFRNNRKGVTEVQTIIGYKGYKALAWRSGAISSMHADVVYSDDEEWSFGYGTDTHLRHKPGSQEGQKTHAYCHVTLKDGGQAFVVLPWAQIMRTRDASQNWQTAVKYGKTDASPWKAHEDTMAAKTAVRYLFQRGDVPMSIEIADAMQIDHDDGAHVDYASFAMSPEDGAQIDGEVVNKGDDGGADPEPEAKKEPEPKKAEPKEAAAEKQPEPEPAAKEADKPAAAPGPDAEMFEELTNTILEDIKDVDPTGVDEVLDLYDAQITQMESAFPALHETVMKAAQKRKQAGGNR